MSILITGGTGFLGLNLARRLTSGGNRVVLYDLNPVIPAYFSGELQPPGVILAQGDLMDAEALSSAMRKHDVQEVIHTAAMWGEDHCREQPLEAIRLNVLGSAQVLEAARELALRRVLLISSRAAYGDYKPENGPTGEDSLPRPPGFYGASKAAADLICESYRKQFQLDAVSLRVTGLYGPGQTFPTPLFNMLLAALKGETMVIPDGGGYAYEFNYIDDVVKGIEMALRAPTLQHGLYNIGCERAHTLLEISRLAARLIPQARFEIEPNNAAQVDRPSPRAPMSCQRFREEMGYVSEFDLEAGMRAFMAWLEGPGAAALETASIPDLLAHTRPPTRQRS